jgi:hypothetical protein
MGGSNNGRTYGVGSSAYKQNTGPNVNVVAVLQADGSVKVAGTTVYNPATNGVEIQQADPATGINYAASVGL